MNEMLSLEKQKSQSGQALVEYVLLLVIGVALILGLANQFYKPLGNWVENQMGPYLECLLDIGELPALGGEAGECADSYKAFNGKPGGLNAGNESLKNRNKNKSSENKKDTAESKGKGSSTSAQGSGGSRGRNQGFKIGGNRGADGGKGEPGSQGMTEKLPESKFYKLRSQSSANGQTQQQQTFVTELIGNGFTGRQRAQGKENASFSAGTLDQSDGEGKPQRLIIKPIERKIASEEVSEPWSFAKYIKFALILLIIVAIILFLAGQFSQISKSMEK